MKPIATVGSMHVCPMCTGTTPHVGGPITQGESNILVDGKPVATMGSMCSCIGPPDTVIQGASNVFFNGKPAAAVGDATAHGGTITTGSTTAFISGSSASPTKISGIPDIEFPTINIPNRIIATTIGKGKDLDQAEENMAKSKEQIDEGGFLNALDFSC